MTSRLVRKLGVAVGAAVAAMAVAAPAVAAPVTSAAAGSTGRAVSASAELSPSARALSADRTQALRTYWSADRRAKAIPADAPARTAPSTDAPAKGTPASVPGVAPAGATKPATGRLSPGAITAAGGSGSFWPFRGDAPATTVGKVFFTDASNGLDYVCSASVVNSEAKNTVWTAGHCVNGGPGGTFHYNWVFYPHYYYGADPTYGGWAARELWTRSEWAYNGNLNFDVGAAVVYANGAGQQIANVTGGQGFAWNQARGQYVYDFGYPQAPPFDGQSLQYCDGTTFNSGNDLGLVCNLTGGASGGPWLAGFNGYFGYVNGVNSYKYNADPSRIYSPYFGTAVGDLYNTVRYRY